VLCRYRVGVAWVRRGEVRWGVVGLGVVWSKVGLSGVGEVRWSGAVPL
jgi:hypothetical protein